MGGVVEQADVTALTCVGAETTKSTTTTEPAPTTTKAPVVTTTKPAATTTKAAAATTTVAATTTKAAAETTTVAATTTTVAATTTTVAATTTTGAGGFKQLTDKIDTSLTFCSDADNGATNGGRVIGGVTADASSWPTIAAVLTWGVS